MSLGTVFLLVFAVGIVGSVGLSILNYFKLKKIENEISLLIDTVMVFNKKLSKECVVDG